MKDFKSHKCRQEEWNGKTDGRRCLWPIRGTLGWVVCCACSWTCGVCGFCREGTHNRYQEWGKAGGFSEDLDILRTSRAGCGAVTGACVRAAAVWNASLYGQNSSMDPWLPQLTHQRTTLITLREKERTLYSMLQNGVICYFKYLQTNTIISIKRVFGIWKISVFL